MNRKYHQASVQKFSDFPGSQADLGDSVEPDSLASGSEPA